MSQIFRSEQFVRRVQLPFVARLALRRADVDQRLERVLHDRLGQAARRVVRAGGAAGRPGGHVHAARQDHHRVAEIVRRAAARQRAARAGRAGSSPHTLRRRPDSACVVIEAIHGQRVFQRGFAAPGLRRSASSSRAASPLARCLFQLRKGHFRLLVLGAVQPQHRLAGARRRCGPAGLRRHARSAPRPAPGSSGGALPLRRRPAP